MPDDPKEFLEECRAILEYEADLPRKEAEVPV